MRKRPHPGKLTPQEKRRNDWHWRQYVAPTGKLIFKLNPERYAAQSEKKWVESEKLSLEQLLSQVVQAICKHYLDLEKERIAAAERNRKAHEEYLIREEAEADAGTRPPWRPRRTRGQRI